MSSVRDRFPDDDLYERNEGVLVRRLGGHGVRHDEVKDQRAPDDFIEDPVDDEHVPGTIDDLPYDYGVEISPAADQELLSIDQEPMSGFGDLGSTEDEER